MSKILKETAINTNTSTLNWVEGNMSVLRYRFAQGASMQLNAILTDSLEEAYLRYLKSASNPHLNIRASRAKGNEYLDDFMDNYGVGHIYLTENGNDVVNVQLLGWATTAMNSNLIEEIKSVYGKYVNALQAKKHGKKK